MLLSSLEGLTPAGLQYLVQTQDKLAATANVQRSSKDRVGKDLEVFSQKSNQKHENFFSSGSHQNRAQHPQTLNRQSSQMMRSLEAGAVR